MNLITRFFLVLTALLLTYPAPTLSRAEEKPATSPSWGSNDQKTPQAGSLVYANGFICSMLEGQAQCHGVSNFQGEWRKDGIRLTDKEGQAWAKRDR